MPVQSRHVAEPARHLANSPTAADVTLLLPPGNPGTSPGALAATAENAPSFHKLGKAGGCNSLRKTYEYMYRRDFSKN